MEKIKVSNLSFSYKEDVKILDDINISFDNKSTAIIGKNGSGKSTFVKLLKGILKPKTGNILINDKNIKNYTVGHISKEIGLVFQNPDDMLFKSKVIDEIMFGPLMIGLDYDTANKNSINALEIVGLKNEMNSNPYDLSLSERKLLSIAAIISMDTDIIILDEPTISQDYFGTMKIAQIIDYLKNKDKLVITIIHDMDFVLENFDRTVVFNEGKIVLDCNTDEVFKNKNLLIESNLDIPNILKLCNELEINETILNTNDLVKYIENNGLIVR